MRKSIVKISLAVAALFYFSLTASAADTSCTHKWSDWKISREATCTSEGWKTRICSVCDNWDVETIPATGIHKWSAWKTGSSATCIKDGYAWQQCFLCHAYREKDIPATGIHGWGKWYTAKKATISKKGTQKRSCSSCKKEQTRSIAKLKPFVKFSKKTIRLKKSQRQSLKITYAKGDYVKSWKSSNKKVATVSKKGKITAKRNGTARITVKMKSRKKATCTLKVSR